ncbi:MAG: hypothetical protein KF874_06855 [Rhizobiaceae bacterium]|nr:hypothetical protein [Rhizobiaceae bacterium]
MLPIKTQGVENMLWLMILYLPLIALLGWSAKRGDQSEKAAFLINLLLLWLTAIWIFGYPALIAVALFLTAAILTTLVAITATSLVSDFRHR